MGQEGIRFFMYFFLQLINNANELRTYPGIPNEKFTPGNRVA
jgi:hypothetical protein